MQQYEKVNANLKVIYFDEPDDKVNWSVSMPRQYTVTLGLNATQCLCMQLCNKNIHIDKPNLFFSEETEKKIQRI